MLAAFSCSFCLVFAVAGVTPPAPAPGKAPPPPAEHPPALKAVDYKLHDLLGVTGATVGFVLAGAILMGGFFAKYTHLFERYRGLTTELRANPPSEPRRVSLVEQIASYRRRVRYLNIASVCIALAVLLFILTVLVASFSVIYPFFMELRFLGTVCVVGGMVLTAVAVLLDLFETVLSRSVISEEVIDIPNLPADNIMPTQHQAQPQPQAQPQ